MTSRIAIFFITDIHGSDVCWRKFLSVPKRYKVDVLVLGGDLTGKMIIPITRRRDGTYSYTLFNRANIVKNESELKQAIAKIGDHGFYPYVAEEDVIAELTADERKQKQLFERLIVEKMREWITTADERLKDMPVKLFISPGNDDTFAIDDVLKEGERVQYCEDMVVDIDGKHEMITLGWVNYTPWNTPRETSEEELQRMLENLFAQARDMRTLIGNIHAPPYQSGIDLAPKLTEKLGLTLRPGGVEMIPVGSKAVRAAIEKYQPLLGLHGHIHESSGYRKIGRTLCINPGSEYVEGILRGYFVQIEDDKVKDFWRVDI